MSRAQSREKAFQLVFEYCITGERNQLSLDEVLHGDETENNYINTVYNGVIEKYDELISEIKKYIKNFSFERIFKVDLAILLVAIYEIKYLDDIPVPVSINEAVNLAKIYSTEKSYGYVNGVLSNFAQKSE